MPFYVKPPATVDDAMASCVVALDDSIFNLQTLSLGDQAYEVSVEGADATYSLWFNICDNAMPRCPGRLSTDPEIMDYANLVIDKADGTSECHHLSGDSDLD